MRVAVPCWIPQFRLLFKVRINCRICVIGHVKKIEQRINSKVEWIQLNTSNVIVLPQTFSLTKGLYGDEECRGQVPMKQRPQRISQQRASAAWARLYWRLWPEIYSLRTSILFICKQNRTWHDCVTSFIIPYNIVLCMVYGLLNQKVKLNHAHLILFREDNDSPPFLCYSNTRLEWMMWNYKAITSFDIGSLLPVFLQKYCIFQPLFPLSHASVSWPQSCMWHGRDRTAAASMISKNQNLCWQSCSHWIWNGVLHEHPSLQWTRTRER